MNFEQFLTTIDSQYCVVSVTEYFGGVYHRGRKIPSRHFLSSPCSRQDRIAGIYAPTSRNVHEYLDYSVQILDKYLDW